jgi:hypothetical protein
METFVADSSKFGSPSVLPSLVAAIKPYQKELEFLIAQVWLMSEKVTETLDGAIVIDAHLEEDKGVIWRVGDKTNGARLASALRLYNGEEISLT